MRDSPEKLRETRESSVIPLDARRAGRKQKRTKPKINVKTLLLGGLMLYLMFNIAQMHMTIWNMGNRLEAKREEKQELLAEQQKIEDKIEAAKNGEYIEKLAREQLGMVKSGERLIIRSEGANSDTGN